MSLFDLQDACIAIGSLATLDLPMVVDLIGIYGLKGPYCMLTMTNWFLQALSVIPRGSWGDVARRSYHDPMDKSGIDSLVVSPSGSMATGLLCNLIPDRDVAQVELDETKARAVVEIGRLRTEAAEAWGLGKEEFLKSSEFNDLCMKRSLDYFKSGFQSCVAQFRANGYSEEEHPAPFLSMARAVEELPNDEEEAADGADEDALGDEATPPNIDCI
ncbi:hypothetical protein F511_36603 [Dorcoceras hygrometricum]|uniref:DNA-directed RNA polymerase V subunit 1 n=1 Tax=Dorcoceras hygrometricum TaxID=472368 RepID=A0A2Z7AW19_9LAMI|nr:hypothetical protein F511_36603 [Dorcoceras hygrometricum]